MVDTDGINASAMAKVLMIWSWIGVNPYQALVCCLFVVDQSKLEISSRWKPSRAISKFAGSLSWFKKWRNVLKNEVRTPPDF